MAGIPRHQGRADPKIGPSDSSDTISDRPNEPTTDVGQLFASTCGYCHSDGGRTAGKGPKLMDSPRSDDFLRDRIKLGKEGAMPAFGEAFSEAQIDAILKYIRSLKPN